MIIILTEVYDSVPPGERDDEDGGFTEEDEAYEEIPMPREAAAPSFSSLLFAR
jgi:hypothetical protein